MVMKRASTASESVVPAGEFKERCLSILDEVRQDQRRLTITKRGKPFADVVPHQPERPVFRSVIGRTPNIEMTGDYISPVWQEWSEKDWKWG